MQNKLGWKGRFVALVVLFPWTLAIIISCGGGGGGSEPTPPVVTDCPGGYIEAGSRGLACLHCNHRNAQAQADLLTDIAVNACIRNVSWNALVDGTFGYDEAFMMHQVDKLTANGRFLRLTLYLLNGPGQRRYKSGLFDGFAVNISPESFRKKIQSDSAFKESYKNHVRRFGPLMEYATFKGAAINIVPQLEDNLTDNAFMALKQLTDEALVGKTYRIVRNPCKSCYPGNQGWIPPGVYEEVHTARPFFTVTEGIVTNDGDDVGGNYDSLSSVRNKAGELDDEFVAWTSHFQGIEKDGQLNDPDKRNYVAPTPDETVALLKLLGG